MFHQNILGRTNYWPLFVIWHFIFYALTPLCYNEVSGFEQEWHVLACTAPAKDIPMQYPTTARPNTYNIHSTTHTIAYVPCDTHICIACPCVVGPGHQMQCTQHSRVFLNGRGNPKSALSGSVLWSWGDCEVWLLHCSHGVIARCDYYTAAVLTAMRAFLKTVPLLKVYSGLQNGCHNCHSTHDSPLNLDPTLAH